MSVLKRTAELSAQVERQKLFSNCALPPRIIQGWDLILIPMQLKLFHSKLYITKAVVFSDGTRPATVPLSTTGNVLAETHRQDRGMRDQAAVSMAMSPNRDP